MKKITNNKSHKKSFKLISNPMSQALHQCTPEIGKNSTRNWLLIFYKNDNNENLVHSSNKRVWGCYRCNRLFSLTGDK